MTEKKDYKNNKNLKVLMKIDILSGGKNSEKLKKEGHLKNE